MLANEASDVIKAVAYLLGGVALVVLAFALFGSVKSLSLKFGKMEATVDTIHDSVNGVDKENDEPVLIQKVRNLATDQKHTSDRVACIDGKLDTHIEQTAANMEELKEAMQSHIESNAEWQTFVKGQLQVLTSALAPQPHEELGDV